MRNVLTLREQLFLTDRMKEYKYKVTLLVNAALLDYPAYNMVTKPVVVTLED